MQRKFLSSSEYGKLAFLFFLQMMATGMWFVPLTRLLGSHGLTRIIPYAYASSAVAAFVSPLVFGAMADRHVSPARVLRWLAMASAAAMAVVSWSIARACPAVSVLCLLQLYALVSVPTTSIAASVVFSRLNDSQKQFGPIRAVGTFGWMSGCWLISALNFDASPKAGYTGACVWLVLAFFTLALPALPPASGARMTLRERMGWDALSLLKNHDHRVVFLTAAFFSVPLAAFYPYTPPQLTQLGFQRTAAWMSLGQITEMTAMFCLAGLFERLRLKWIFAVGLFVGVLRFSFSSINQPVWLLAGITLHGFSYTLVFITEQIYLNERIDPAWRARAQALMSLMNSGFGSLAGYLGAGFWFAACSDSSGTRWTTFWFVLATAVGAVLLYFLATYHGRGTDLRQREDELVVRKTTASE
jgi:nucleoside transporter